MNFEHLKTMKPEQLVELHLRQLGRKPHPKAKPETVIKNIMESALLPQVNPDTFKGEDMRPKAMKSKEPEYNYSEQDVLEACAEYVNREGFELKFPGDGTMIARYRGSEDSLNLKQPMQVIKRKLGAVAQGKRVLMGLTNEFDSTHAGGKSAYTNTVLAV